MKIFKILQDFQEKWVFLTHLKNSSKLLKILKKVEIIENFQFYGNFLKKWKYLKFSNIFKNNESSWHI
jgi:hypothetical protein